MRISDSSRVLFVHVQKTGGSSVDRVFDDEVEDSRRVPGLSRHASYHRLLRAQPELAGHWSCGFVRNPWARMVSWFSMVAGVYANLEARNELTVRKFERFPKAWTQLEPFAQDFDKFVLEAPRSIPRIGRSQLRALTTCGGRRVDFVGRTENFDFDLNLIRDRLGLPPLECAPQKNVSRHGHYTGYYTDLTRRAVEEHYADDIEAFGFTFDDEEA